MLLRNGTVIAGKRRMDQARKHSSFLRPNEWLMDCGDFSNGVFAQAISCRKLGARASRLPPLQLKHQHEASEPEDCYRSRPLPLV
ncbi:uncharacterized protein [Physcomitrium patens]|uniref:uncharacterized protein isoform X4 n=1 Tax=Physcomitrium patens TaxID=3218 RepID=UPI003CCDACF0